MNLETIDPYKKRYPWFLGQEDSYSCGPVAIANALAYTGMHLTKEDIPSICEFCNCKPPLGAMPWDITHALFRIATNTELFTLEYILEYNVTPQMVRDILDRERVVIANFYSYQNLQGQIRSHYVFGFQDKDAYVFPNYYNGISHRSKGFFDFKGKFFTQKTQEETSLHPLPQIWVLNPKRKHFWSP